MNKILNVFCQHGASTSILADAHPHIGTDKLPRVIENMRNTIIECGGEVHFETRMDSLIIEKNKNHRYRNKYRKDFQRNLLFWLPDIPHGMCIGGCMTMV